MRRILARTMLPVALVGLMTGLWISADFAEIAAGVAIFVFGMLMLEDGFTRLSGPLLERWLTRATGSLPRAIGFGFASASVMQSSTLVSIITISFLSAGLIPLAAGVGVILGANVGTTTGAWLIAGFGLKVDIAAFALPLLAVSIVLTLQSNRVVRAGGYILAGIGFVFLGIHHIKEGFEAFSAQIDLTEFALTGLAGLVVFTALGAVLTAILQSSHATMVLVITAVAAGQITFENALALAVRANIGTTVTAVAGGLAANYQGKRLALAHVVFNVGTGLVILILLVPLRGLVGIVSDLLGIAADDYALRLAVFHTVFNMLGVLLVLQLRERRFGVDLLTLAAYVHQDRASVLGLDVSRACRARELFFDRGDDLLRVAVELGVGRRRINKEGLRVRAGSDGNAVRVVDRERVSLGRDADRGDHVQAQTRQVDQIVARERLAAQMRMHQAQTTKATLSRAEATEVRQHHLARVADHHRCRGRDDDAHTVKR